MRIKTAHVYPFFCGVVSLVLAATVIFGWYTYNQSLVQVHPSFAPMQYNTALGFLFCGLGLVTLALNQRTSAIIFGAFAFFLAVATLVQYVGHLNFGIDDLFIDPVFLTKTSHPGRMSPITALCFSLSGLAFLLSVFRRSLMISLSLSVLLLACLALAGYLIEQETLYGWGTFTRMAIHTAAGFVVVGSGLVAYSVWGWGEDRFDLWQVLPFSLSVIVIIMTLFGWYTYEESARVQNRYYFESLIDDTQDILLDRYTLYEKSLFGGLGLFYASKSVEREEWRKYVEALSLDKHLHGISGIGYIDYVLAKDMNTYLEQVRRDNAPDFQNHPETFYPDKFIIKFIEPVYRNLEALGLDIGFEANRRAAAERARDLGVPALTKKIFLVQDHKKQPGFLLLIPVYDTNNIPPDIPSRRKHLKGWVYAPFIGSNFLSELNKINKNQLGFEVYDGRKVIPAALIHSNIQGNVTHEFANIRKETKLKIAGRTWTIVWRPNQNYTPPVGKDLGIIMLVLGLVFSTFLYFTLEHLIHNKQIIGQKVKDRTRALKESENRQRAILNNTVDAIITIDARGIIQSFNPAAEDMFGYSAESIIGENISTLMPEPHHSAHDGYLERFMRTKEQRIIGTTRELEARHRDGRNFPISLSVSEVELEDSILFSGIIRDITAQKKAEEEILTANEELKRSNHELERFAYIASHDLQEPLRKIGGFTERLEKKLEGQLDEKTQKYMEFITGGVDRMRELIMGLLAYSRVATSEASIGKLEVEEVISVALDNLSELIKEHDAKVHFQDLPAVYYDKVMLTQIFQNLIGNAIKYRSEATPDIRISASALDEYWEFAVQDNGMGMEEKYLERIFEMFQRLHRKEEISGTGIGLSLCQKIIERYGGTIRVASKPGEGSTFFFTVPVKGE